MRRPRVPVRAARPGLSVELSPADTRHLVQVLRRGPGDEVELLAGGRLYRGVIEEVRGSGAPRALLRVGEEVEETAPRIVPWTVAAALVKSADMDSAVRLASELGLLALVPLLAERSPVGERSGRPERWRRIARESAKQCGRREVLRVEPTVGLRELLATSRGERRFILDPGAPASRAEELRGLASGAALFLVGPEGGFSEAEQSIAREAGATPLGLPTPILRTPTAVVLVAALGLLGGGREAAEGGKISG
ncbi:MAG: RsmE family RNA methyltransferase [Planctomycetota bacterium]|nr:RsmE family RNA methyltransferase [Planctomycetota bacterium]